MKPSGTPLINRRAVRDAYLAAAAEWHRPTNKVPTRFYQELNAVLQLKIQSEAAHPHNTRPPNTK